MAEYIEAKSILSRLNGGPDPYFGITYNMNLYRGCQHQCIYCDSRSLVYGLGDLANIRIKSNAIDLLEKALRNKRKKGTIGTGSMNDPYMPIEATEGLTRRALEVIKKYNFPVHVLTKSSLVLRDTDLLSAIGRKYSAVSLTITTSDDLLSKKIEPGAVVTSERFKTIEKLSKAGIYCGVLLTPVLPYVSDTPENIEEILSRAKEAGASYVLCWMGMTQREGQREYYYNKLDNLFPGLRRKYAGEYGLDYNCASPRADELYKVFNEKAHLLDIPTRMKFYAENLPEQLDLF